jgi:hypothetical protein
LKALKQSGRTVTLFWNDVVSLLTQAYPGGVPSGEIAQGIIDTVTDGLDAALYTVISSAKIAGALRLEQPDDLLPALLTAERELNRRGLRERQSSDKSQTSGWQAGGTKRGRASGGGRVPSTAPPRKAQQFQPNPVKVKMNDRFVAGQCKGCGKTGHILANCRNPDPDVKAYLQRRPPPPPGGLSQSGKPSTSAVGPGAVNPIYAAVLQLAKTQQADSLLPVVPSVVSQWEQQLGKSFDLLPGQSHAQRGCTTYSTVKELLNTPLQGQLSCIAVPAAWLPAVLKHYQACKMQDPAATHAVILSTTGKNYRHPANLWDSMVQGTTCSKAHRVRQ